MKNTLLALTALLLPLSAGAATTVEWVHPENYKDAYSSSAKTDKSREVVLQSLEKFLIKQGNAELADGQSLKLSVTDVDLAGEYEPWTDHKDTRVIKGAYFARIAFSYELTDANGQVLKKGDEVLVNQLLTDPTIIDRDEIAPYLCDSLRHWLGSIQHK